MAADPVNGLLEALETIGATDVRRGVDAATGLICLACGQWLDTCWSGCNGAIARAALIAYREAINATPTATRGATVAATCEPGCQCDYCYVPGEREMP